MPSAPSSRPTSSSAPLTAPGASGPRPRPRRRAAADGYRGTDDAMLVERLGVPVQVVPSYPENLKITTADDLERAEQILSRCEAKGCGSASATISIPSSPDVP